MKLIEIRNDDVLQPMASTKHQRKILEKPLFDYFLEADQIFADYNYPQILACVAEGVTNQFWINHIRKNRHRYQIELHALYHINYRKFSKNLLTLNLGSAIRILEDTFECKVTIWYLPFGRKGVPPIGDEVCESLGIKMDHQLDQKIDTVRWLGNYNRTKKIPWQHTNFHYWYNPQVKAVREVVKICSAL